MRASVSVFPGRPKADPGASTAQKVFLVLSQERGWAEAQSKGNPGVVWRVARRHAELLPPEESLCLRGPTLLLREATPLNSSPPAGASLSGAESKRQHRSEPGLTRVPCSQTS